MKMSFPPLTPEYPSLTDPFQLAKDEELCKPTHQNNRAQVLLQREGHLSRSVISE